mmetsp:Transcript_27022/g.57903  ORF Transcript_27022/g.57903 Transcript_27022/m.57903 type:complete len:87 (-) Transcript_27022:330-590(-)
MESSGTMYAWAKRARDNFALVLDEGEGEASNLGFDANAKILEGLNDMHSPCSHSVGTFPSFEQYQDSKMQDSSYDNNAIIQYGGQE